ncbi:MAG: hypothetical protein JWO03_3839 [Bacteroidetes bacterium]|nr:hypothetical protein [Bacteroidota bacterium]
MSLRLYHISEEPGIALFEPRPSPSAFDQIRGDVVFAVSGSLLHNYLLPRNCPRVTFYAGAQTTEGDKAAFLSSGSKYVVAVELSWREAIRDTPLYCYEFSTEGFELLDENAGYYISYGSVRPVAVRAILHPLSALAERGVEAMFVSSLWPLAEAVQNSTLSFSLIRMSHAERKS